MLGQGQEILGSVGENARTVQENQLAQQKKSQGQADVAMAPGQQEAASKATAQGTLEGQSVTITPQLAEGLVKATGDESWRRAMGTKMAAPIYSALVSLGAKKAYQQALLDNKEDIEKMREQAHSKDLEDTATNKKDLATFMTQQKEELLKWEKDHGVTSSGAPPKPAKAPAGSGKEDTPETKKLKASKLLDSISKAKDASAKQSLVANYNQLAGELGLEPYKEGMLDQLKSAVSGKISSLMGGGGEEQKPATDPKRETAIEFLKKNNKPLTDANIKYVMDNQ